MLKKNLDGLKQAQSAWDTRSEKYFKCHRSAKCPSEHTLYVKVNKEGEILIVCLYADDLIFTGKSREMIQDFKEAMVQEFKMTDIGHMSYCLGLT